MLPVGSGCPHSFAWTTSGPCPEPPDHHITWCRRCGTTAQWRNGTWVILIESWASGEVDRLRKQVADLSGRLAVHRHGDALAALADAPSVAELKCECENPDRGWYTGRDGELHCDQCDGRKP